jgi:hypothetical protein
LALSIRSTLALAGPPGAIVGEFLTHFVPGQRLDRCSFVELLNERVGDLEAFKQMVTSSPN